MTNASFEFPVEEIVYKTVDERQLKLYLFKPQTPGTEMPAILFFNGGSFARTGGSVAQFQHHAKYFSDHGFAALCVDCRNGGDLNFSPMHAISDARDAYIWVKEHGRQLHVDPDHIVMCGASSGGYTVLCAIMIEGCINIFNAEQPRALVIFNAGVDGVEITNRLFPHLNDQAATRLSPLHHVRAGLPPMIWFVGTSDLIYDDNKRFYELWVSSGNACLFVNYEGLEHGFFNYGRHANVSYYDTLERMHRFLDSILTSPSER